MFNFRNAAAAAALVALTGVSSPSRADDVLASAFDTRWLVPGPSEVIYYGEPADFASPDWYRRWLFLRQNSSSAALYNQPCLMSNGYSERAVPCKFVAIAELPPGAPAIVDGPVSAGLGRAPLRYRHRHWSHGYAVRAKY
jgi:hypothetical protein